MIDATRAESLCEGFYESIKDLPPPHQLDKVKAKLTENHGATIEYTGQPQVSGDRLWRLSFSRRPQLRFIYPLKGLPVEELDLYGTAVEDLSPLKGMPLKKLNIHATRVSDLGPLRGVALTSLACAKTSVSDLSPLQSMKLAHLNCEVAQVSDLTPLEGMPLEYLDCGGDRNNVHSLEPLRGMPLRELHCKGEIASLAPLEGMNLVRLAFTPEKIPKGISVVRQMSSLKHIEERFRFNLAAEEFWKKYDAGEFK